MNKVVLYSGYTHVSVDYGCTYAFTQTHSIIQTQCHLCSKQVLKAVYSCHS